MPIRPDSLIGLQRESYPVGQIRAGTSEPVPGKSYRRPVRLATYRLTSYDQEVLEAGAALWGGRVRPWEGRPGQFDLITEASRLEVYVPPRLAATDSWMELWNARQRERKCDGVTEILSGRPCMCPQPEDPSSEKSVREAIDERLRLAALNPPRACRPRTLMNMLIPQLPGHGVWRLTTQSYWAARWNGDTSDLMELARDGGVYLRAVLRLEQHQRADGKPFSISILQPVDSLVQIASGALPAGAAGLAARLAAGPQRLALASGNGHASAAVPPDDAATAGRRERAVPASPPPPLAAPAEGQVPKAERHMPRTGQEIADAALAATDRGQVHWLMKHAQRLGCVGDLVCTDPAADEYQDLKDLLDERYDALPAGRRPAGARS
jgi:Recombination directionality factor-like